jgi:hypothetical protein
MLGVAVQSRPNYIDYDHMISSREAEARITNYVPIVRESERVLRSRNKDPRLIRQAANKWWQGAANGELLPLPQLGPDDEIYNGVKGQILNAARDLSSDLCQFGEDELAARKYGEAAHDFAMGLLVLQPLKYSDLPSIAIVGTAQRRLLSQMSVAWPRLSSDEKRTIKGMLAHVRVDEASLQSLMRNEKRVAIIEQAQTYEMARAEGKAPPPAVNTEENLALLHRLAQSAERNTSKMLATFQ